MTRIKQSEKEKSGRLKSFEISFASLGEYPLQTHSILDEGLGPGRNIPCAIRNQEELLSERLELQRGEELHARTADQGTRPLLRFDQNGLWAWMEREDLWFPMRNQTVELALDSRRRVRLKFAMTPP